MSSPVMRAVLFAGGVVPVVLHVLAPAAMPWWPDTISLAIAFGVTAGLIAARYESDREAKRRLWRALQALFRRSSIQ